MTTTKARGHAALRLGRNSLPYHAYHITACTKGRQAVFSDFPTACAAARCFENPQILGDACLLAWVLMPDHAHWLLQLGEHDMLESVVKQLKSASARASNHVRGCNGSLWGRSFHDHALRKDDDIRTVARYIIANPIRAGLVTRVGDYPFWNAAWL